MRIKITAPGIYGQDGEIPVGTEITVKDEPKDWAGRYEVIGGGSDEDKEPVVNPKTYKAEHRGRGSFSIMDGDGAEVAEGLSKADADTFNAMSDEDKAAFVSDRG